MSRHLTDETIERLLEKPESETPEEGEHLASCEECQQELVLARTVDDALADVPRMEAPPALLESVMTALAVARLRRRRVVALAAATSAMALVAVAVWLVSGGAATVVLDALELGRSLAVVARVTSALWNAFPLAIAAGATLVLFSSGAALARVMARTAEPAARAEAG